MSRSQKAAVIVSGAARAFLSFALSAVLWLVLLLLSGITLVIGGVFVLAGLGWSMVVGGVMLIAAALFVAKGMSNV